MISYVTHVRPLVLCLHARSAFHCCMSKLLSKHVCWACVCVCVFEADVLFGGEGCLWSDLIPWCMMLFLMFASAGGDDTSTQGCSTHTHLYNEYRRKEEGSALSHEVYHYLARHPLMFLLGYSEMIKKQDNKKDKVQKESWNECRLCELNMFPVCVHMVSLDQLQSGSLTTSFICLPSHLLPSE